MNIEKSMIIAQRILEKSSTKFSQLDIEILMSKAIVKDRKYIILNLDKEISKKNLDYFNKLVLEYLQRVAYSQAVLLHKRCYQSHLRLCRTT